jgi:hypothetical protein
MTSASADSTASLRTITPRVARRAWLDPHVRTTLLAGLALLAIAIGLLIQRISTWREAAQLINHGLPIDAQVIEVNNSKIMGRSEAGDRPVTLRFDRDGKTLEVNVAYLEGRLPEEPLIVGKTIKIRVDPNDSSRWTPRQTPTPIGPELLGGGIALATGVLVCGFAAVLRARLLKTFRTAPQLDAVVLAAKHVAIAPRAWQARCSPVAEGDNRVFTVYIPPRANVASAMLHLLTPRHGRPLALEWFE